MNFLQDIIFQTLPENVKNWFNAHAFGGVSMGTGWAAAPHPIFWDHSRASIV